jgi:hypothetical protein
MAELYPRLTQLGEEDGAAVAETRLPHDTARCTQQKNEPGEPNERLAWVGDYSCS